MSSLVCLASSLTKRCMLRENLGRARDLSTHKYSFSVVSYHIIWEKLQNECSDGSSNSNKEINHYHEHVRGAGFAEIERSWIHHGSNGPSATKRQVKVRRKIVYRRRNELFLTTVQQEGETIRWWVTVTKWLPFQIIRMHHKTKRKQSVIHHHSAI